ncbi:MAG: MATE family efflux transporter [Phascolarctobacterium sp.]|nr:MATE family efflux transporter [Phascolarctobacterium sp.]
MTMDAQTEKLTDKEFLGLTVPFMLSTMTQPLMGAVNTAVMGQLPDPKYIAAVSLGAILFNNLYWLFGFLRVSTTGYAAQAHGAMDRRLSMLAFFKPLVLAIIVSLACILLQKPIVDCYLGMIGAARDVNSLCRTYYYILIWGAPMVLFNYVALGWLMGQTRVRASVFMQVSMNVLNMALSIFFVFTLHMDITGVAIATLLSQIYGGVLGAYLIYLYGDFDYGKLPWGELLDWRQFIGMLQVNANLMIRTACLLTVNNIIAAVGASLGTVVLAANAVLLQLKDIMSYLIDGMANGAAIFSGRAVGGKDKQLFEETIATTYKWLGALALLLMGSYYFASDYCIRLFTSIEEVIATAKAYDLYVLFYPVCAGVGMVLYGVFCGATRTAPVRNMMLIALGVFYVAQHFFVPHWGNAGLWLALLLFMLTQSLVLSCYLPLLRKLFTN